MFTGLISDCGEIARIEKSSDNATFHVRTNYDLDTIEIGESIAIDGACLTVTALLDGAFTVDASPETLRRTTLGDRAIGDRVHLERALRLGDRLGGHLVLGHVDGVGRVRSRRREKNAWLLEIEAPDEVATYLIEKGSVAMDGVSLTVNTVDGNQFDVAIIPHTSEKTNLNDYDVGRAVNLEADVLGKYVRKLLSPDASGLDLETLRKHGFSEV